MGQYARRRYTSKVSVQLNSQHVGFQGILELRISFSLRFNSYQVASLSEINLKSFLCGRPSHSTVRQRTVDSWEGFHFHVLEIYWEKYRFRIPAVHVASDVQDHLDEVSLASFR
jgi:hypothetical protein